MCLQSKAILALTHDVVDDVNNNILSLLLRELRSYLSNDSPYKEDFNIYRQSNMHLVEFLNTIKYLGFLNHELKLKIGVLVMLMRNID